MGNSNSTSEKAVRHEIKKHLQKNKDPLDCLLYNETVFSITDSALIEAALRGNYFSEN